MRLDHPILLPDTMLIGRLFPTLAATLVAAFSFSQELPIAELDDLILEQMDQQAVPGAAVGIVIGGQPVFSKAYGWANVERKTSMSTGTQLEIGPISNIFLSATILRLANEGKLSLADPAAKYVPALMESYQSVTIKNLLSNSSFLPDYLDSPAFKPAANYTSAQLLGLALERPKNMIKGTGFLPSATDGLLLGMIVEKICGQRYDQVIEEQILGPAGMKATMMNTLAPTVCTGYMQTDDGRFTPRKQVSLGVAAAAGVGFVSSLDDLIRWDELAAKRELLPLPVWQQMFTPASGNAAEGATLGQRTGRIAGNIQWYGQSGGTDGFSCCYLRMLTKKMSIIVLSNGNGANTEHIAEAIIELLDQAASE